jgi:hypothetical protein
MISPERARLRSDNPVTSARSAARDATERSNAALMAIKSSMLSYDPDAAVSQDLNAFDFLALRKSLIGSAVRQTTELW